MKALTDNRLQYKFRKGDAMNTGPLFNTKRKEWYCRCIFLLLFSLCMHALTGCSDSDSQGSSDERPPITARSMGFTVRIVNATPWDLELAGSDSYQMEWKPVEFVERNSSEQFYGAFKYNQFFMHNIDDNASADYVLCMEDAPESSRPRLRITASVRGMRGLPSSPLDYVDFDVGYGVKVHWQDLPNDFFVFPPPTEQEEAAVGWLHDGTVTIGIGYFPGRTQQKVNAYPTPTYVKFKIHSALPSSVLHWAYHWMELYSPCIENLKLTEMTLPGSHDSGTYVRDQWDVTTQILDIKGQLMSGVRVLDLRIRQDRSRPGTDRFVLGHGIITFKLRLSEVLEQVRSFLEKYDKEIIILDFHEFRDRWSYQDFNQLNLLLWQYLSNYIILKKDVNTTLGEIWETDGRVIISAYSGVLGNFTDNILAPIIDSRLWCTTGVEQMYQGKSVTTWSEVRNYMNGVLFETTRPWDHLWSLQTGYYNLNYGSTWLHNQVSNFFSFANGLKANIISMDWYLGVSPATELVMHDGDYPNPNSGFSPQVVGVPLNMMKGYRKLNGFEPWEGGAW